jgi:hypothetical protein
MELRKIISRGQAISLGYLLVFLCSVIKVNGELEQPNPHRTVNGPDLPGKKV